MSSVLGLPENVMEKLDKKAKEEETSVESIIVDAITTYLGLSDPETRAEIYRTLSEKYLREAEELLAKKDYVQASEKAWGAASLIVKSSASRKGLDIRSHAELHRFVSKLSAEREEEEIRRLWQSATALHQNFYENWLPDEMVIGNVKDVKELIEKVKK